MYSTVNQSTHIMQPSGVLDSLQAQQVRQATELLLQAGGQRILIDLGNVTFIDSSGLGVLVLIYKAARLAHSQLAFCSAGDQSRMLFEITGMDQVFEIFPDQASFLEA